MSTLDEKMRKKILRYFWDNIKTFKSSISVRVLVRGFCRENEWEDNTFNHQSLGVVYHRLCNWLEKEKHLIRISQTRYSFKSNPDQIYNLFKEEEREKICFKWDKLENEFRMKIKQ